MTSHLRWRDRLHNRIFAPIALLTIAIAGVTLAVTISTINEAYEDRLTEQLLGQRRLTERVLRDMERRLSFYARSLADAHSQDARTIGSRVAGSLPVTMLESLRHEGMAIEYHSDVSPGHRSYRLMRKALLGMAATGLVSKKMPEGKAYFLEGVAAVREGDHVAGVMAVDLALGDALLRSLRGGRDASLTIVAQGELVATTLGDRRAVEWIVKQANKPDLMHAIIGEGKLLQATYRGSTPALRLLFTPFVANFANVGMLVYGASLEPLIEARRRILWQAIPAAALGLFVIFAVYNLFIRRVTLPLRQLSGATVAVAAGNLDTTLTAKAVGELRILADAFSRMVADLRVSRAQIEEWNRKLEERVADRTRQLEEMQTQLVQAGKLAAIGELASGLAHELRNPMAVIRMSSNYLARKVPPGEKIERHVRIINEEIERIDRLIADLLGFARPKPTALEPTDLGNLVEKSLSLTERELRLRGIRTVISQDSSMPLVLLDPNQIRQVLINLILNACQAMNGGGTLTLRCGVAREEGGRPEKAFIEVTDTGEGISAEHLQAIFTPFFTTKDSGTGLGLSVSQSIIRAHKGEIRVKSQPGKGTTFRVTLPVSSGAEVRSDA